MAKCFCPSNLIPLDKHSLLWEQRRDLFAPWGLRLECTIRRGIAVRNPEGCNMAFSSPDLGSIQERSDRPTEELSVGCDGLVFAHPCHWDTRTSCFTFPLRGIRREPSCDGLSYPVQ